MKRNNLGYWRVELPDWVIRALAVCALTLMCGVCTSAFAEVIAIRTAKMTVETSKGVVIESHQSLPFKWDSDFAGENGSAIYELTLPARAAFRAADRREIFALYVPRVGNQVQLWLNGQAILIQSGLDNTRRDMSQEPLLLVFPASLLHERDPNRLVIVTTVQALRWGGLSEVYFGSEQAIARDYEAAKFWQQTSYVVILVALVLMGLLSALIWWRQRSYQSAKLYFYFVWSALAGSVAAVDHLLTQNFLPWPIQGIVTAVALAWHVIFMSRFALEVVGRQENWVSLAMLATTVAVGIAYVLAEPFYWTMMFGLLCLPLVAALVCTAQAADSERSGSARWLFFISLIVAMAALRDFFIVQWPPSGMSHFVVLPQALFLFVLVMGWILVKRYTEQHRLYHELNIHLEARVSQREQQLAQSFEALQLQGQERVKLLERQRIMQDIHDGVGGQLVSLVNMVKRGNQPGSVLDARQLQEHAQLALDELRIAVDAMQPVQGDLATVLATLRYRLEPRLKAAGIKLAWAVQDLPVMGDLTPQKVLQIQKILLEALTNVMLHAKAKTVTIAAQPFPHPPDQPAVPSFIEISLMDDGVGFDVHQLKASGHGLANMRFRADAIGARLTLARGLPEGTVLKLQIPI